MATIGIIAGAGQFPFLVAKGAIEKGHSVVICGLEGNTDPSLLVSNYSSIMLNVGQLGSLISFFKKNNVTHVCMAGSISKPKALGFKPDMRAAKLLFKLAGSRGDDAILRAVADELTSEGFAIIKPEELVPTLKTEKEGLLTGSEPSIETWKDIALGWKHAKALGALDIGQAVVIKEGVTIAVEAIEGTDAMITRAGQLISGGCTLVKVAKPGQDERADLPSLGTNTIELLHQHGFIALAFEADRTLFFDQEKSLGKAKEYGISIIAVPAHSEVFFANKIEQKNRQ